jgi:hypothetical protein
MLPLVQMAENLSAVNHSVSAVFLHLYDGGLCWVLKGKLKGAVFDIVIRLTALKHWAVEVLMN